MFIEKSEIDRLQRLSISSVAIRLGLEIDSHRRILCPFHDDHTPSLVLYPSRNRFHCYACGASGGVIDLAMKVLNKGFTETCLWLSQASFNEPISCNSCNPCSKKNKYFDVSKYSKYFEHPYLNQRACDFLFDERKLNPQVIEWCRLSSWRDSLQIPYFDITGRLIGVQFRNLGSSGPRFRFPSGSQCHIYNLPILSSLSPDEDLYISEGCSDCWSLMSAGHKAIAIPSATLLNNRDLEFLSTLNSQLSTNFHMYPDADEPGESLYNQLSKVIPVTRHPLPEGCKDYSDAYVKSLTC